VQSLLQTKVQLQGLAVLVVELAVLPFVLIHLVLPLLTTVRYAVAVELVVMVELAAMVELAVMVVQRILMPLRLTKYAAEIAPASQQ
jgi:hypothetical protein